jgi:hypothetical protein
VSSTSFQFSVTSNQSGPNRAVAPSRVDAVSEGGAHAATPEQMANDNAAKFFIGHLSRWIDEARADITRIGRAGEQAGCHYGIERRGPPIHTGCFADVAETWAATCPGVGA